MEIAFVTHFSLSAPTHHKADSIGGAGVMNSSELMKCGRLFPLQVTYHALILQPLWELTILWFI
jgi:hypothetical protein